MNCPRCAAKASLVMALASDPQLPSREPNVFVQYLCEQGHYFIILKVLDGTIPQEHYLTSVEQNPDIKASFN